MLGTRLARVRGPCRRRLICADLPARSTTRTRSARVTPLVGRSESPLGTALALIAVHYRKVDLPRPPGGDPRPAARRDRDRRADRRVCRAGTRGRGVHRAWLSTGPARCSSSGSASPPSTAASRRRCAAIVVGYATGYALHAPDAAARRRRRRRGAPAVRAHLGRVSSLRRPQSSRVFAYRVFNLWLPLGPAALRALPPAARAPGGAEPLAPDAEVGGDDRDGAPVEDARAQRRRARLRLRADATAAPAGS